MRFIKQLIYGIFWLAVLGGIAWLVYSVFIKPAPSCFDGRQNGKEEGVDCGRMCGKVCLPPEFEPLSVRNKKVFQIGTSTENLSVLIQIQNPNSDYAAKKFGYTLTLGDLVINGKSFIYAGEIKYLAFPNLTAVPVEFNFWIKDEGVEWIADEDLPKPTALLQSRETVLKETAVEVNGRFKNGDTITFPMLTVVAILFDSKSNPVGVSQTVLENVLPDEVRSFTVVHPFMPNVNISGTQVFVYPSRP